ncbi:MAG: Arc family DNA binding domain-containing protein [Candidatus Hydrogenedentes bacterium]|nr:Arc family DNA binding domain-containing protein [Candidatus Hydrogenedentota bacterium]
MAERKSLLLRLPPELVDELNRWAKDDLRSLNAQVEYVLREAVRKRRRVMPDAFETEDTDSGGDSE